MKCPSWKGPTGIKKGLGNAVRHRVCFWGGPVCSWELLLWELRPGCKEKKTPSRGTTNPKAWVKCSHCGS